MSKQSSWRLRAATSTDADAGLALLREVNLPTDGFLDRFPEDYVVAKSGGIVIAVAGLETYGAFGLLRSMAVSPEWRQLGIAKALTDRILELARALGLQAVYLLTTTAPGYFAGRGFAHVDRKEVPAEIRASIEFASACPASAVCMFKILEPRGYSPITDQGAS